MAKDGSQVDTLPRQRKRALPTAHRRWAPESQVEREIFARNLRFARIAAGHSQRELSKITGLAQAHISEIENALHNVCIDTMVKLARALKEPSKKRSHTFLVP